MTPPPAMLAACRNQLEAKIGNGQIAEPPASELLDLAKALEAELLSFSCE